MLVKMLKYDLKNVLLKKLPLYVIGPVLLIATIMLNESWIFDILIPFLWLGYICICALVNKSVQNYWQNKLFGDNAYFTYSLPISKKNIYISKFLTDLILALFQSIIVGVLIYIFFIKVLTIKIIPIYYILIIIGAILLSIANDALNIINNILLRKMNILNKTAWMIVILSLIFNLITVVLGGFFLAKSGEFSKDFGVTTVTIEEINNLDMNKWEKSEYAYNQDGLVVVTYYPILESSDSIEYTFMETTYQVTYPDKNMNNPISIEKHSEWNEEEWKEFSKFINKYILIFMIYLILSDVIIVTVAYKMFSKGFDII